MAQPVGDYVHRHFGEREVHAVDGLRQELHRLDRLQASLWGKAMDGDLGATTIGLKVIDQRIRLLGLQARILSNNGDPKVLVIGPVAGDEG